MGTETTKLEQAISLIDCERSYIQEERRAFVAFRERLRLTMADPTDATSPSETTKQLLSAYREEVMEALDYEAVYDDTISESLEVELSPATAQLLHSKEPLTQRRKRKLLVETTAAIERREEFSAQLEDERKALETFAAEFADIEESLQQLPACSAQNMRIEQLVVVWEVYEELLKECEQLLERRQQQIQQMEGSFTIFGEEHACNQFLYGDLDTQYPVLAAIAEVCERIDANRNGEQSTRSSWQSLAH